jgi:gliding motility-associated-like protein
VAAPAGSCPGNLLDSQKRNPMNRVTTILCFILSILLAGSASKAQSVFPVDTIYAYTFDCNNAVGVCVPLPAGTLQNYMILQDGLPYASGVAGCDFDTIVTYNYNTLLGLGNMGPYHLDSWVVNGKTYSGEFANITALVSMMNLYDPQGAWTHQPATYSIKGGAPGSTYSNMQVTVMVNQTPSTIGMNFGLLPQGTKMDFYAGNHYLVAVNMTNSQRDTLAVMVQCLQAPPPMTLRDTIPSSELPYTICMDLTELPGDPVSIQNICPGQSGEFVSFYVDAANYCVKYLGLKCDGEETACIVVCDNLGVCDTTYLEVYVDNSLCLAFSSKINDTLLINFSDTFCLDTTVLPGTIVSVENLCPGDSGISVDFDYDETTHCLTYIAFGTGLDRACYLLKDEFGNTDTVYLCVVGRLPQSGIILDTILLGQDETYCIDTSELAGNVISIQNFCPASSGNQVIYTVNTLTLCVDAFGTALGVDTACIAICDDYGVCDTTYIIIIVVPDVSDPCTNALPPIALDDTASTHLNTPVDIDVLANDTLGICLPVTLTVLNKNTGGIGPNDGFTVKNIDQSVTYVPNTDFCGTDTFQYVLCSPAGCDTATVVVSIACSAKDTIIIYNGFSPNNDGVNDFFKIENIEKFPGNELMVYNRWGLLVYNTLGYKNDWYGSYRSADLPDGTYFYILNLDGRQTFSGHLQLHR